MGGNKILQWLLKSPMRNGYSAAFATFAYCLYSKIKNDPTPDFISINTILPPALVHLATYNLTILANHFVYPEKYGFPTKKERKQIKKLEEIVSEQKIPELSTNESVEFQYSLKNLARTILLTPQKIEEIARKEKNPVLALRAVVKYFGTKYYQLDTGLILLRDANSWIENKKPELRTFAKLLNLNYALSMPIGNYLSKKSTEWYFFRAAYEAITKPDHAWYWSALGKKITEEFNPDVKDVAYVFHALMATAQNRTDQEEAWQDAVKLLQTKQEWERIGETRTTVRTVKNNKYLSSTIIFKERPERELLEKERKNTETLEKLIDNVKLPQPLYITNEQYNGNYTYVMRIIEGETLYEKLQKNDKTSIPEVITALAKIHSRYPELPRINLEKKLEEKLYNPEFQIPKETAEQISYHSKKIIQNFENTLWAWNKDAHPENWIISDKIGIIDLEADHFTPATFDLANLLEYGNYLTNEEKKKYITQYSEEIQKEGKKIENIHKTYYESVIYRMLCLASAWSSPYRKKMKEKIPQTINNAINATDILITEYSCEEYRQLKTTLEQLKTTL